MFYHNKLITHTIGDNTMLKPLETIINNPDDKPYIPQAASDYIQGRLNASLLYTSGKIDELKKQGASESYILGFITGCEHASNLIDFMQFRDKED